MTQWSAYMSGSECLSQLSSWQFASLAAYEADLDGHGTRSPSPSPGFLAPPWFHTRISNSCSSPTQTRRVCTLFSTDRTNHSYTVMTV